jgi:hypothetical protein
LNQRSVKRSGDDLRLRLKKVREAPKLLEKRKDKKGPLRALRLERVLICLRALLGLT